MLLGQYLPESERGDGFSGSGPDLVQLLDVFSDVICVYEIHLGIHGEGGVVAASRDQPLRGTRALYRSLRVSDMARISSDLAREAPV